MISQWFHLYNWLKKTAHAMALLLSGLTVD